MRNMKERDQIPGRARLQLSAPHLPDPFFNKVLLTQLAGQALPYLFRVLAGKLDELQIVRGINHSSAAYNVGIGELPYVIRSPRQRSGISAIRGSSKRIRKLDVSSCRVGFDCVTV